MIKANSFDSIEVFDDEEFHNRLELIRTQASHKPLNMIVTVVVGLFKELLIILSCFILIHHILGLLAGLMIICAVTNAAIFIKIQNLVWQDSLNRSKKSRFINYLSALSINSRYINELRFFGYAQYVEKLHEEHSKELYVESQKTVKKLLQELYSLCWLLWVLPYFLPLVLP
jgi:hypothetical protein